MAGIAVAVAVVLGALLGVRLFQGAPPAATWVELDEATSGSAPASAGPGDQLRVARPGDTYWGLAGELAPGEDPRPIVDRLVERNGGTAAIAAGQELVIPSDLLE
ncbi:MAG: hypothetical protein ACFCVK_19160 [Acidimicrobiales bacterium]